MPDITKCAGTNCPTAMKKACRRFTATASKLGQSWADFKPESRVSCSMFLKETSMRSRKLNYTVKLAGNGVWGAEKDRSVVIGRYEIKYWGTGKNQWEVLVEHDSTWDIYTDMGFLEAVKNITNMPNLQWSEQGMQKDGVAHLEPV